jgi:hypothetical protein
MANSRSNGNSEYTPGSYNIFKINEMHLINRRTFQIQLNTRILKFTAFASAENHIFQKIIYNGLRKTEIFSLKI